MKCKICGKEEDVSHFIHREELEKQGICFSCDLWQKRAVDYQKEDKYLHPIIDGVYYTVGDENSKSYFRGFGGSRFQIEFEDGHKVISTNLWCGGDVPEIWRSKLSNNAKFENNLKWKQIGESICLVEDPK